MSSDTKKSIAIIGGGIIGLMSAWRLLRAGHHVWVFERHRAVGMEATCAAVGALMPLPPGKEGEMAHFQRHSHEIYPRYMAELSADADLPNPYRPCKRVQVLRSVKEAENTKALSAAYPESLTYLSEEEVSKKEPAIITLGFGALLCHDTAACNPNLSMELLSQAIEKLGGKIFTAMAVSAIEKEMGGLLVCTEQGRFRVDDAVVCGGVSSGMLAPHVPVTPVKGQGLALRMPRRVIDHLVRHQGLYIIQDDDLTVRIGATSEPKAELCLPDEAGYASLLEKAYEVLPCLRDGEVTYAWAGMRPKGPDGKYHIAREESACGALVATGHFKVGIGLAPATAERVVKLINSTSPNCLQSS